MFLGEISVWCSFLVHKNCTGRLCSYPNRGLFRVPSLRLYAERLDVCLHIYIYVHTHAIVKQETILCSLKADGSHTKS